MNPADEQFMEELIPRVRAIRQEATGEVLTDQEIRELLVTPIDVPRDARLQLWEGEEVGPVLYGTWEEAAWGLDDSCYRVNLDSGQSLHIWLGGDAGREPRPKPHRIVLHATDAEAPA